ncbi:MAG TPA: hypothetical protein VIJ35_19185 [Bradyrhizobium sp.]
MRDSFSERMAEGQLLAQVARNRGQSTGRRKGCQYPKRSYHDVDHDSWAWLCEETRREWRSACRQAQNDFAAACLNGPGWQNDLDTLGF